MNKQFDSELTKIYNSEDTNKNEKFLKTIFSFLQRKTSLTNNEESHNLLSTTFSQSFENLENTKSNTIETNAKTDLTTNGPEIETTNLTSNDNNSDNTESEASPPKGNGGKTDKYVWTQTLSEVNVFVDLPLSTKGKDIKIKFTEKNLFVSVKGIKNP